MGKLIETVVASNGLEHDGITNDTYVSVNKTGYSGTTYAPHIDRVKNGSGLLDSLYGKEVLPRSVTVELLVQNSNLLAELDDISAADQKEYELIVESDRGSGKVTRYKGYLQGGFTTTKINQNRTQRVTLRAKDELSKLNNDFVPSDYGWNDDGVQPANAVLASVLSDLGLNLPIKVKINDRPTSHTDSDHPLAFQIDLANYWDLNSQGDKARRSKATVLKDIAGIFGAELKQDDSSFIIVQPTHHSEREADTVNDQVDVWEYNSSGTFQQKTTEPEFIDLSNANWEANSDQVSGQNRRRYFRHKYVHNTPTDFDVQGSFEDLRSQEEKDQGPAFTLKWEPSDASDFGSGSWFTIQTDSQEAYPDDGGTKYLEAENDIEAQSVGGAQNTIDYVDAQSTEYAYNDLGYVAPSVGDLKLTLRYTMYSEGDLDYLANFWRITLEGYITGDTWAYDRSLGWLQNTTSRNKISESNPSPNGGELYLNGFKDNVHEIFVAQPPEPGIMRLDLYQPAGRHATYNGTDLNDLPGTQLWTRWDGLEFTFNGTISNTLYFKASQDVGSEEVIDRRYFIGDGPYENSPGGIRDKNGNVINGWVNRSTGDQYERLHELITRRGLRYTKQDNKQILFTISDVDKIIYSDRAVKYGSKLYWPVSVQESQPNNQWVVKLEELDDRTFTDCTFEILTQDFEQGEQTLSGSTGTSVSSDSSSGSGSGSTTVTWGDVSGKPSGLFSSNGGSDGIAETSPLQLTNINSSINNGKLKFGSAEIDQDALLKADTANNLLKLRAADDSAYYGLEAGPTTIKGDIHIEGAVTATGEVSAYTVGGGGGSGSSLDLGDLGDVSISSLSTDDIIQWNGTDWVNVDGSSIGGGSGAWSESGSDIYYSSGNVGIGTSSPAAELHIKDSNKLLISHSSGSPHLQFLDDADNDDFDILMNRASDYLTIRSNGSEVATYHKDGKIGLGTNSPVSGLTVDTDGGTLALRGETSQIRFIDNVSSDFEWRLVETGADFSIQRAPTIGGTYDDYIYITNDGDVGIGTSSPDHRLTVSDSLGTTDVLGAGVYCNRAPAYIQNLNNGGDLIFRTHDSSGNTKVGFEIKSDGSFTLGDGTVTFGGGQTFTSTAGFTIAPDNNAWVRFDQADQGSGRYFDIEHGSSNNIVARFSNEGNISFHGTDGTHALDVYAPTGDVIAIGDVEQVNNNSLVYLSGGNSDPYVGTRHGNTFNIRIDNSDVVGFRSYGINMLNGSQQIVNVENVEFKDSGTTYDLTTNNSGGYNPGGVLLRTHTNPSSGGPLFTVMSSGGSERLRVEHNGKTSTTNDFEAAGEVTAYGLSDERLKEDITRITNPNNILARITGYNFTWKEDGTRATGYIAQDVKEIFPDLIREDEDGFLRIKFGGREIDALHTEAIKENHREVKLLKNKIKRLERSILELENE